MQTLTRIMLAALLLGAASAGIAPAADETPQYEGIPSYSVTRLKIFEGSVWVRTPDSGEWEEFQNNSPIPEKARVSVPEDSEAELQFHGGQFMLLVGGTELDLQRMDDGLSVFRLRSGEIRFDLPEEDFSPVRVLTSEDARVDFHVPGKYWLFSPENEDPRLVVRAGEATVTNARGESAVRHGEEARIGRDVRVGPYAGGPAEQEREEPGLSDEEREAGIPPAAATELRDYGEWVHSTEYGYVWRPRVAPGWSPYYYGRWVWISPYGWTWISSEPWGWYPYHYGYWYDDAVFGWVWYPFRSFVSVSFTFGNFRYPHFHRRVYFVPATVRFVGYGSTVRWVPLRPGERFHRVRFTRADRRLVRWERPLPGRTVFVRREGPRGREWADWRTVRSERLPSGRVRPERRIDQGREGSRERQTRPGRGEASPERERSRERPDLPPARRMERGEPPARSGGSGRSPERERVRERPSRRGSSVVPEERERGRERSVRPGGSAASPERERVLERRDQPPARRMERQSRESRRPEYGRSSSSSRRSGRGPRMEPAAARPNRSSVERRPAGRSEFRGDGRVRERSSRPGSSVVPAVRSGDGGSGRAGRGTSGGGGWTGRSGGAMDRGGGSRRSR